MARAEEDQVEQGQVMAPFWEKVTGAVGLVLVLTVLGYLIYEALNPQNPPDISVEQREVTSLGQGFLVQIRATNHGDRTAATVVIEAALHAPDAGPDDPPLEAGDVTFDFVPAGSSREGGIVFTHDPADYTLDFQVRSFVEP